MLFCFARYLSPFLFVFTLLFHLPYLYPKEDASFEYYIWLHKYQNKFVICPLAISFYVSKQKTNSKQNHKPHKFMLNIMQERAKMEEFTLDCFYTEIFYSAKMQFSVFIVKKWVPSFLGSLM